MRLLYCRHCKTLSKLDAYEHEATDPEGNNDALMIDWIQRHTHGLVLDWSETTPEHERHPGANVFNYDFTHSMVNYDIETEYGKYHLEQLELAAVQEVNQELLKNQQEISEYRDELRYDAGVCFIKHHNPSWPGMPCRDYQSDSLRIGRKNMKKEFRMYLCTMCPYESSVTVAKRHKKNMYGKK